MHLRKDYIYDYGKVSLVCGGLLLGNADKEFKVGLSSPTMYVVLSVSHFLTTSISLIYHYYIQNMYFRI